LAEEQNAGAEAAGAAPERKRRPQPSGESAGMRPAGARPAGRRPAGVSTRPHSRPSEGRGENRVPVQKPSEVTSGQEEGQSNLSAEQVQQKGQAVIQQTKEQTKKKERIKPRDDKERDQLLDWLAQILASAKEMRASDIHMAPGREVMFRVDGELVEMNEEKVKPYQIEKLIVPMLSEEQLLQLEDLGELDFAYSMAGFNRLRVNVFRQRSTYAMAIRILSFEIPDPRKMGIPEAVIDFTNRKRGLVLVTGATGSGKSTTLAALLGVIAKTASKSIITLEDPIEYVHRHHKSMVIQREIGYDSQSYANALRAALRQDPDVILVGEMRDLETISIAITAAETGHLVFSTLHTNSAAASIDRMIDVFPPHQQQQIRVQLASVIEGVVSQQLLPKITGGRVAAFEVLIANFAIRNLIREGKSFQIPSMMQTGRKEGMQVMDDSIYNLYAKGFVDGNTAVTYALDQAAMRQKTMTFA